ncbi:MAG: sulfatase-like hydrolase/transferase [Cryobacterium sp.]|nr:sulfatase-like hydrolase/transferase [Oligoflexia bacterium]
MKLEPRFLKSREVRLLGLLWVLFWIPRIFFLFIAKESPGLWKSLLSPAFLGRTLILDLAFLSYTFLPLWALRSLFPRLRTPVFVFESIVLFIVLLSAVCEPIFMVDMEARYNFIAVDYLVYTHEVIGNLWESYPVIRMLLALGIVYAGMLYLVNRLEKPGSCAWFNRTSTSGRIQVALALLVCTALFHFAVTEDRLILNVPMAGQDLAKNGSYALFAAYRNNTLDFDRFYQGISPAVAERIEKDEFQNRAASGMRAGDVLSKPFSESPNVILVLMESMSARFLGAYGGKENLTPNLDRLTREGLWFSSTFSTGTRTVRGIEAVTLSLPPTPGQSIVRRPDNENLYNLGTEFQKKNYRTSFLYGGRGFFDNMGPFFEGCGFDVVDHERFSKEEITFETAWGVCDENLFAKSIREADITHEQKKPFFQFILTTSNHRPYRYPDGKVAIASGVVRQGAIQYSDYAIGKFLEDAKTHSWFKNTVFIFVADHNASVAGGSGVIPRDYLIPVIFYAPDHLKPTRISEVGSQVDVGPTLFDLLGWKFDEQKFFGSSLISHPTREAFFGTYQNIGRMKDHHFVLLKPKKQVEEFTVDSDWGVQPLPRVPNQLLSLDAEQTISDYTTASRRYSSGALKIVRP